MMNERPLSEAHTILTEAVSKAIADHGHAIVGLSGGSTPKPIYEAWGKEKIDWSKVWIFLVDDRYIRADDPKSNQFLLRSTVLKHAPIPESQLILPDTSLPLPECIANYDKQISDVIQKGAPDIITLGMGDDGHIASLFPPVGDDAFGPASVIHTTTETFDVRERISVTFPVLTAAKESLFLLKGIDKKNVWEEMVTSTENEKRWPAKAVLKNSSCLLLVDWLLD